MSIANEATAVNGIELRLVSPNSKPSPHSCVVLRPSEVMTWSEEKCKAALTACLDDTALALRNASLVLKIMIEKKYDISTMPKTWVRAMLRIADGGMIPEVMRDFDGIARKYVSRMPIDVQRKLCENSTVEILTEFGDIKREKIQSLNQLEIRRALSEEGPRSIEHQRQLIAVNDEKIAPVAVPGTLEDALDFFSESKVRFGHLKELASLYAMIDMFKARFKKRV